MIFNVCRLTGVGWSESWGELFFVAQKETLCPSEFLLHDYRSRPARALSLGKARSVALLQIGERAYYYLKVVLAPSWVVYGALWAP